MFSVDPSLFPVFLILYGCIGLCLGSFATALIYREERGLSWFHHAGHDARSYCPNCKKSISPRDLIPVLSWVVLKGRCRNCSVAIPRFYPIMEMVSGICAMLIFLSAGFGIISISALVCLPFVLSLVYMGIFKRSFSWRLVIIVCFLGVLAFFIQNFAILGR